jgi:hypothetical protein
MSKAITTKVYGRRNASRTIHIKNGWLPGHFSADSTD